MDEFRHQEQEKEKEKEEKEKEVGAGEEEGEVEDEGGGEGEGEGEGDIRSVGLRTSCYDIKPQTVLTRDSVTVIVDGIMFYQVKKKQLHLNGTNDVNF